MNQDQVSPLLQLPKAISRGLVYTRDNSSATDKQTGDDLRDDCCNGCTGNAHMEDEDKKRIQKDIQDCSDHHRCHTKTGKSLSDQKTVHAAGD